MVRSEFELDEKDLDQLWKKFFYDCEVLQGVIEGDQKF